MRSVITRGLYLYNPLFEVQKRFFKEFFSENYIFMYGWYSRVVCNQEWVMMARIWYMSQFSSFYQYFNPKFQNPAF